MLPLKERRISTGSAGSAGSATQVWRKEKWDQNLVRHVAILWGDEQWWLRGFPSFLSSLLRLAFCFCPLLFLPLASVSCLLKFLAFATGFLLATWLLRLASSFLLLRLVCFIHLLRHLLLPSSLTRSPCWRQGPADIGVHFWLYLLFIDMMESQYSKLSAKTNAVDFALNPAGLNTLADLSSISPNKTRHSRKMLHVFMFAHVTGIHSSLVFFHSSPMWIQGLSLTVLPPLLQACAITQQLRDNPSLSAMRWPDTCHWTWSEC